MARLEQERADLQIEIDAFRQAYWSHAGAAQAELEALELRIAEYRLRNELVRLRGKSLSASQLEAEVDWQMRRQRNAAGAGHPASDFRAERNTSQPPLAPDPAMHAELKALYRDLAKRAHPDLTTDDAERASRSALMAKINEAYRQSDVVALKAIISRSSAPGREAPGDDMGRLRAEITRLDGVIAKMRAEIADVNRSEWMAMKLDAALARSRGIDWFEAARRQAETLAAERRAELDGLIAEFMELVRSAGLT